MKTHKGSTDMATLVMLATLGGLGAIFYLGNLAINGFNQDSPTKVECPK